MGHSEVGDVEVCPATLPLQTEHEFRVEIAEHQGEVIGDCRGEHHVLKSVHAG